MARTRKGTPPSYPSKAHNGQARITVRLTTGARHCLYLGTHGSPESRREYQRVLALMEANGGGYPVNDAGRAAAGLTINEVAVAFWSYAEKRYRLIDGSPSRELEHYEASLRPLLDLFGDTLASEYGPVKLKALREQMVGRQKFLVRLADAPETPTRWLPDGRVRADEGIAQWGEEWRPGTVLKSKPALSRRVINQRIDHVKRFFAWAVSEELVPASIHDALLRVTGLRRGHEGTRDMPKVSPVSDEVVEATLPHVTPQVAAMVRVQRLIGARSTEICQMIGRRIVGRDRPVWAYRIDPNEAVRADEPEGRTANMHKTAHHESADGSATVKLLPIGPKAQAILRPWLRDDPDEYLFQPGEARAACYKVRRAARQTPLYPSHVRHQADKKKGSPKRSPRKYYDRHSYGHAVARGAKKAGVAHWHPHQLKHACGTQIREGYDAESAQVYIGHSKLSTTEIYAEKNWKRVEQIALEIG